MKNQIKEVMELVCAPKYLEDGESFKEGMSRIADTLKDSQEHFQQTQEIMLDRRFLPAGRIQASVGAARQTTAFNCYVSDTIEDSMSGIMARLTDAAETMRLGGGDGFDFSTLRPKGAIIKKLGSTSSGPISFMGMWDSMCATIKSAGHRRGAMMAVLRVDHPDIEEFITCKQQAGVLTNFNISVAITDEFMKAVKEDLDFELRFDGVVYKVVKARMLWNKIMRNTWDHAEPGVLFMDKINRKNNLYYCETIAATNPCGEQPLPPNGACLLGSFNLTRYCKMDWKIGAPYFNYNQFTHDIAPIVRMMDNVIDNTIYPLKTQEIEAKNKRRMGLGVTGVANAMEFLGHNYGSEDSIHFIEKVMTILRDCAYQTSISLAMEKGPFPLFDREKFCEGQFFNTLPLDIQANIFSYGLRNSHLLSIAPTGTISLWAHNISSGIEPVFAHAYDRTVYMQDGSQKTFYVEDYAYSEWGLKGKTSADISAKAHIDILCAASRLVDSACSKTANVGDNVTFDEFKDLYMMAYDGGASGCTTFRPKALEEKFAKGRGAVLSLRTGETESETEYSGEGEGDSEGLVEGQACFIDPQTGERLCAD
jgi:ribonucleoside-diphosphate reductase alpha chain